jgi:phosphatidylglycerophosphate synthase
MPNAKQAQPAEQVYSYQSDRVNFLKPANLLTFSRVLLLGLMIFAMIAKPPFGTWIAFGSFILAAGGGVIDGYVARRRNEVTTAGQLMDAWLNKIVLVVALMMLANRKVLPPIVPIIVAAREMFVLTLRAVSHERTIQLPNLPLTPIKNAFQYAGPALLLLSMEIGPGIRLGGMIVTVTALLLTCLTAAIYTTSVFGVMRRRDEL